MTKDEAKQLKKGDKVTWHSNVGPMTVIIETVGRWGNFVGIHRPGQIPGSWVSDRVPSSALERITDA